MAVLRAHPISVVASPVPDLLVVHEAAVVAVRGLGPAALPRVSVDGRLGAVHVHPVLVVLIPEKSRTSLYNLGQELKY